MALALAGVNEVAFLDKDGKTMRRVPVGRRPTAFAVGRGQSLVVVNTFDDSLSLLDPRQGAVRSGGTGVPPVPPVASPSAALPACLASGVRRSYRKMLPPPSM